MELINQGLLPAIKTIFQNLVRGDFRGVDAYFSSHWNISRLIINYFYPECLLGTQIFKIQELHLEWLQVRDDLCSGKNFKHDQIWTSFHLNLNLFGISHLKQNKHLDRIQFETKLNSTYDTLPFIKVKIFFKKQNS